MTFPINLYKSHGVFAPYSGLEPSVIIENGLVRLWYHGEDYELITYAPGQSGYGTKSYPFINNRVDYMDCSVDAFFAAVHGGTEIPWANHGTCAADVTQCPYVVKNGATYYLFVLSNGARTLACFTSSSGNPGSWTQQADVLQAATYDAYVEYSDGEWDWTTRYFGNMAIRFNVDTTVDLVLEYADDWPNGIRHGWTSGYWHGVSLGTLAFVNETNAGGLLNLSEGPFISPVAHGVEIVLGHGNANSSVSTANTLPTDLTWRTAPAINSTAWLFRGHFLTFANAGGYFAGDVTKPFPGGTLEPQGSQLADPHLVEYNGKTYVFYETIWQELYDIPSLSIAWWDGTFVDVVGENILGITPPTGHTLKHINGSAAGTIRHLGGSAAGTIKKVN